jgi:hypothetical protein
VVLPDTSLNAMYFNLKEFDFTMSIIMVMPQEIQSKDECCSPPRIEESSKDLEEEEVVSVIEIF